jgi:hypothetical protein
VICVLLSAMGRFEYSAYLKYSIYLLRLLAQSHLRGFACWNNGNGVTNALKIRAFGCASRNLGGRRNMFRAGIRGGCVDAKAL